MSNTHNHKIEHKFKQGLIKLNDIPNNIRRKWDRINFEIGYFRSEKRKLTEKIMKREFRNDLKYIQP